MVNPVDSSNKAAEAAELPPIYKDNTGYAFYAAISVILANMNNYSGQIDGIGNQSEALTKITNDLSKVQQDIQNLQAIPSGTLTAAQQADLASDLKALNTDMGTLQSDFTNLGSELPPNVVTQVTNTLGMLNSETMTGGSASTFMGTLNNWVTAGCPTSGSDFTALMTQTQTWNTAGTTPTGDDALNNWVTNGEGEAMGLKPLGTQVGTALTNDNQELQEFGAEIQQMVQSAQNSQTALSQEGSNYISNQKGS